MRNESFLSWRGRPLAIILLAVVCLTVWSVAFSTPRAEAGSLVIPAWSFARGNVQIFASPDKYADTEPVVGGGPRKPWGWTVEYDVDIPVTGAYAVQIRYASAESRPVEIFMDNQNLGKCCTDVTIGPVTANQPDGLTFNSSGAGWGGLRNQWGHLVKAKVTKGKHTVKITRGGPLPHIVTVRLDTEEEFPEDWRPPQYKVRDPQSVPEKYRAALQHSEGVDVAALRLIVEDAIRTFGPGYADGQKSLKQLAELGKKQSEAAKGSPQRAKIDEELMAIRGEATTLWSKPSPPEKGAAIMIPAWTFDRGNAKIYASPDQFADAGPMVGSPLDHTGDGVVEYDIDFPSTGDYGLRIVYAAAEARPVDVSMDDKNVGKTCLGITFGSAPFEHPVRHTWNSSGAVKKIETMQKWGKLHKFQVTKGKHTLKLSRKGPLPNLLKLQLECFAGFPEGWKKPVRKVRHIDGVPPEHRTVFLPPDAVNVAALQVAIKDTMKAFGPRYPDGEKYLGQLAELEKKQVATESGTAEDQQKVEVSLESLRRDVMLAHPALKFDKLLFVKRPSVGFNTYQDNKANEVGGNLCILSPVTADGKVTTLVPELDGGRFTRFDLSYDAKKIVFGYKKKDGPFRIHEIEIDPVAGKMVPGSLRQLTFTRSDETECVQKYGDSNGNRGFDDMDPCYLPNGDIMFSSTRPMRRVFCNPSVVASLHLMDGDGKNLRCLSAGPLNEVDPSMLDDGRVVYTRWEYVDKGLGNGQSLWAVRPDGSGSEHIYKNMIVRPAQMLHARNIPGSRRLVTVGAPHCGGRLGGTVILVDYRTTRRSEEAMTCITPEIAYPCMSQATWNMGFFQEPYPFSEKFFLCSHKSGAKPAEGKQPQYGLYVLDGWGNRAELYLDPEISCYQPVPLQPRRRPTDVASFTGAKEGVATADRKVAATSTVGKKLATLFIQDIYQGLTGIERGRVKYVRVLGVLPWPWQENGMFRIGMPNAVHRKKVYGVAKVYEDGSAYFNVPADENLLFQACDENFMALQHMPSFINLMEGEQRSCIGCHESRRKAPGRSKSRPLAFGNPAQDLMPLPGDTGPRMIDYAADVQSTLDKRCVSCHGGENAKGRLDLTGVPTAAFNQAYGNIVGKGLISFRDCRYGRSGFHPEKPLTFGSHLSQMVERIGKEPCKSDMTREEFVKIITWIDANAPYYGTYKGRRGLQDKDHPDFRAQPLAGK